MPYVKDFGIIEYPENLAYRELPVAIQRNLIEAHRRYESFHKEGRDAKPLEKAWVGLGFASEYRQAVEEGIFKPLGQAVPRVMGWYLLTEKGVSLYKQCFE